MSEEVTSVRRLRGLRGSGIFHAHDAEIEGESGIWVTKWPNHERASEMRLLVHELIVARLGSLFDPAITPDYRLVRADEDKRSTCQAEEAAVCNKVIGEGLGYASRLEEGVPLWTRLPDMTAAMGANVFVFQTWCGAHDAEILGNRQDRRAYAIDHEDSLWGWAGWNDAIDHIDMTPAASRDGNEAFRDRALLNASVDRLESIEPDQIRAACEALPDDWSKPAGASEGVFRYLAGRQALVRDAVDRWLGS